jgi:hypothetical protein
MSAPDEDKVRDLLHSLATPEGRSDLLTDPAGKLSDAGIDVPEDLDLPQEESDLKPPEAYRSAAESVGDTVQFGDTSVARDSPELASWVFWFIAAR